MKKLLLILAVLMVGCSAEENEPEPLQFEYLLSLQEECMQGTIQTHQVTEDLYRKITASHEVNDCAEWHIFPDKSGVWHEGYLAGVETTDPDYLE